MIYWMSEKVKLLFL